MKKFNKKHVWYGGKCCISCKGDNQPYMLKFELWKKITKPRERNKLLCIPCVENRLKRKLKLDDFIMVGSRGTPLPINNGYF